MAQPSEQCSPTLSKLTELQKELDNMLDDHIERVYPYLRFEEEGFPLYKQIVQTSIPCQDISIPGRCRFCETSVELVIATKIFCGPSFFNRLNNTNY